VAPDPDLSPAARDVRHELEEFARLNPDASGPRPGFSPRQAVDSGVAEAPEVVEKVSTQPDPIGQWFPCLGPCLICSTPGADQHHRVIEAIASAVNAGDGEEDVAADYNVPVEAVRACLVWVREHPDGLERSETAATG